MAVGDKTAKVPVCFLCLKNVGETPGLNGSKSNNGDADLELLRKFLCLSLELPPAVVVGDLLCSKVRVATGAGHDGQDKGQGQVENLLCGNCAKEVSATCQLYRDLARKLKELEGILEKSTEAVSETLSDNLHEKVATQLSGNGGGGGDRVKRLRNLLASKLHKRGRKLAGEDEAESRTLKKSQPMSKSNLNQDNAEVTENGAFDFEKEENVILNVVNPVKVEMDDDNDDDYLDDGQAKVLGTITKVKYSATAPAVVGSSNSNEQSSDDDVNVDDDDDDVKRRPFQCLRCNDLFETIEAVADHVDVCRDTKEKPMEVERQTKPKPAKAQKKRSAIKSKIGKALKRLKSEGKGIDTFPQRKCCRFCGKKCPSWYHVTAHERIHTGEKSFECGECKRKFNKKWNCKRHELTCQGEAEAEISDGDDDDNGINSNSIFQQIPAHVVEEIADGMEADEEDQEAEKPGAVGWIGIDY